MCTDMFCAWALERLLRSLGVDRPLYPKLLLSHDVGLGREMEGGFGVWGLGFGVWGLGFRA